MTRTVWIVALALAAGTGAGCKDSNPNYISFDAQAPVQATDAKSDVPSPTDGSAADVAADHQEAGPSADAQTVTDAPVADALVADALVADAPTDVPADTAPAQDAVADGTSSDAAGADAPDDATTNDGGDGQ